MSARRRNADQSLSPSTSIHSHGHHSTSDDDASSSSSSNSSQYDGLTEDQLYEIWSRRNLAYFDRRQRLLAEEEEQQQQQQRDEDDSSSSDNSNEAQQQQLHQQPLPSTTAPTTTTATTAASSRGNSNNNLNNEWMSKNLMGEYNSHRAATEPSYHNSWMACQRLVNMYLSSSSSAAASTSNNNEGGESDYFVPMNPRLAELLECRRVEMARERYMAEVEQQQQREQHHHHHHQQQQQQRLKQQHCSNDNNGEALHTEGMDIDNDASDSAAAVARRQQVAEYERLSQAHRLQQQQHQRQQQQQQQQQQHQQQQHQQQQQQQNKQRVAYYMALPNTTQQFTQSVICSQCNCALYTTPIAQRFFCNICGCISDRQLLMVGGGEEEKMMDVED